MSTTIDQRVVEMRFDNKEFEKNVQTSLSTLEKLKQKLNLTGASKGLEGIGRAAKNVDFSPMANSAEKVAVSISHTWATIQHQIDRYVDRMVDSAERAVKALTIDPIKTGLQEYETQIGAVQTILANTSHQGTTLNDVNSALDTLNQYADKTIYNFTEMTRNIGTFTAAGVDLQTSVDSIQGIANLAAVSGSTSQQASTAMYQLSQALAAGKVSLMDWNSVVNAGMGGKVFQDALIRTSELLNTGAEAAIKAHGSFRESLTKGEWLTTDVLTETLKQFAGAYTEADLIAQGFTKEQAKDIAALAETASDAATKVKTFTQLWDTLKEAAQSGWTQTWELIIGDFEEAKSLWTGVSDVIGGFINNISESRNKWLGEALNTPWEKLIESVNKAGVTTEAFEAKVKEVAEDHGLDMDKIESQYESFEDACRSGAISSDILSEAMDRLGTSTADLSKITGELKMGDTGEDVKQLQEALKGLGHDFSKFGVDGIIGEETTAAIKAFQEAQGLKVTGIVDDKTLEALREATENSNSLIGKCKELTKGLDELGGRELMLQGFANIFDSMKLPIQAVKAAFKDIFPPTSGEVFIGFAEKFVEFTKSLKPSMSTIRKLHDTFEGLFSAVDIVVMAFKSVGKAIFGALGSKGLGDIIGNVLDVTAALGRFVTKIRDAIKVGNTFDSIAVIVAAGVRKLLDIASIPADIIAGFVSGLSGGAGTIIAAAIDIVSKFLNTVKDLLGIHSPSTEMYDVAMNCIQGLVNGIAAGLKLVVSAAGDIGKMLIDALVGVIESALLTFKDLGNHLTTSLSGILGEINFGKILAVALSGGTLIAGKKIFDIVETITSPLSSLDDVFDNVAETVGTFNGILEKSGKAIKKTIKSFSKVLKGFGKLLSAKAFDLKATALLKIAAAIAVLAAAVALLTFVDQSKLISATACIAVLVIALGALAVVVSKMMAVSSLTDAAGLAAVGMMVMQLGIAMILLAATMKIIGTMEQDDLENGILVLGGMMLFLLMFTKVAQTGGKHAGRMGSFLIKISLSLLLLVAICKLVAKLSVKEIHSGMATLVIFGVFVALMGKVAKGSDKHISKFGGMMIKLSIAMGLMVAAVAVLGSMKTENIVKGELAVLGIVGLMYLMIKVVKTAEKDMPKVAGTLMAMGVAIGLMGAVVAMFGLMDWKNIAKGELAILGLVGIMKLLANQVKSIGNQTQKVAGTIIAMSVAIGILAGVSIVMGLIDIGSLAKGLIAVGLLSLFVKGMVKAANGVGEAKGTMIGLAIVIGVVAAAVVALSFIDTKALFSATAALSILMTAFSLIAKGSKGADTAFKSLIVMTVAIGVLAGVLYLLSGLPVKQSIGTAIALSTLMIAIAASLKIISKTGRHATDAILPMALMGLIVAELAAILWAMGKLEITGSIETALSLSVLLVAMSAAVMILSRVGPMASAAYPAMLALAVLIAGTGLIIATLAGLNKLCGGELLDFLNTGIPILEAIGFAIGSFFGNIADGLMGSYDDTFATKLTAIGDAIGQFGEKITGIDSGAIDSAKNIGLMMAAIAGANLMDNISKFLGGSEGFETLGTKLGQFGDAVIGFSDKITGKINEEAITSAANVGMAFAELCKHLPKEGGIAQDFAGTADFTSFSNGVAAFCEAIIGVNEKVSAEGFSLHETTLTAIAGIGTAFTDLQNSIPKTGGVLQEFAGASDFTNFSNGVSAFVDAIVGVNEKINTEGFTLNESALTAITTTGTNFATLQTQIPKTGGVLQEFAGASDFINLSNGVTAFCDAIIAINEKISAEGFTINETALTALSTAGTNFATLQGMIPKTGGVLQTFIGEGELDNFAAGTKEFCNAIIAINESLNVEGFTINEEAIASLVRAGTNIAKLQTIIPQSGGWWQAIAGEKDIGDFGTKICTFGTKMVEFTGAIANYSDANVESVIGSAERLATLATELAEVDMYGFGSFNSYVPTLGTAMNTLYTNLGEVNTSTISSIISSANRLKTFIAGLVDLDASGIGKFKVGALGLAMRNYNNYVKDINVDAVSTSVTASIRLKNLINGLSGLDTSGVDTFIDAVKKLCNLDLSDFEVPDLSDLGSDLVTSIVSGITSKASTMIDTMSTTVSNMLKTILDKTRAFKDSGVALMNGFITGLRTASKNITIAVTTAINSAGIAIRAKRTSFYTNGQWLGDGLVQGINSKKQAAYYAGYALGQKAVQGEKDGQKSNSPSKLTEQAGKWLGEGLVIGINKMTNSVYKSGKNLGKTAANSMTMTASRLAAAIDTDIDTNPTIRPVLDLSGVEAGAGSINTMLSGSTIGVTANVGAISSMMNNRRQNGTNAEIVSAIGKLSDKLNNLGNTTYQVNGITYDDGSNISAAVRSLVHAAKVERRI